MTDAERDALIEKSLLKELDSAAEARVQQLRREDDAFRQDYDFQATLMRQVQLARREELLRMFADFDAEQKNTASEPDATPIIPLPVPESPNAFIDEPKVIPLWQKTWVRVAATIILVAIVGAVVWRQFSPYAPQPVADEQRDSTNVQLPKDTVRNKPAESPSLPQSQPTGPVAHEPSRPARLQGPTQLPYYETNDISMGFGKNRPTNNYRTVFFGVGPAPAYEFQDTLKVYLPVLPAASPVWSLVYNRNTDTYYLITGKTRYEIVKGLQGRQPLTSYH